MSRSMLMRLVGIATLAVALVPAAAGARTRPLSFKGKTKEGTKISFVLDRGWVDQLDALLPTTCISVQGGTPRVDLTWWRVPYKFHIGGSSKLDYGDPTKHYTVTAYRRGKRVLGKLEENYSLLGSDGFGSYKIWHCLATANFDLRAR
jgi:hypothetical protein